MKYYTFALLMGATALSPLAAENLEKDVYNTPAIGAEWIHYNSSSTQDELARLNNLSEFVKQISLLDPQETTLGFSEKSPEARFFLAGTLYSEALALLRDGDYPEASSRIETLADITRQLGVPDSLDHYLRTLNYLVNNRVHHRDALVEMMELFQPLISDFSGSRSRDMNVLLQSGSWLVDLSLGLAVGDTRFLQQQARIEQVLGELERMEAPKGVLDALREIQEITSQEDFDERDIKQVSRLVKRVQELLG